MLKKAKKLMMLAMCGLLALGGVGTLGSVSAKAAIHPNCSVTPMVPYKSGNSFVYRGTVNCSTAIATRVVADGQRQTTASWTIVGTNTNISSGTTSLSASGSASLLSGTSTYRSRATGTSSNGGQTMAFSRGIGISR